MDGRERVRVEVLGPLRVLGAGGADVTPAGDLPRCRSRRRRQWM